MSSNLGVYFDELDKICIIDPELFKQTTDMKEECLLYTERLAEFQKVANKFIHLMSRLGENIEKEKMKIVGLRNTIQSMEKEKQYNTQQLQALVSEKTLELDRLKAHLHSLQKTEALQNDLLNELSRY